MEPNTRRFLRGAVLEALNAEDDAAAMELMTLLGRQPACCTPEPVMAALPAARVVIDGPAHDYYFWARFIREQFIPFMTENGRMRFTSHELMSWMQNCGQIPLTVGDLELQSNGRETWRTRVSSALAHLKMMGCIAAPAMARDYQIEQQLLAPSQHTP